MEAPRVPVQIVGGKRVEAGLRFAAGADPSSALTASLSYLCEQLAVLCAAPIASVYVLEGKDDLVLRGNHGFDAEALGEVRLQVGQGITGTAVETLRPVRVDDAGLTEQFAYFPQLAEERYPAFLAVPLLSGSRPRGALVLQREAGPFSEDDVLLALACARSLAALVEVEHPAGANLILSGTGNGRGRTVGLVRVLSRVLTRREGRTKLDAAAKSAARRDLLQAFADEQEELRGLLDRARAAMEEPDRVLGELSTVIEDARLIERASEHLAQGTSPSQALERIAAESARVLSAHGPSARRALDVEAFVGGVAHRHAGLDPDRVRRGELLVAVHLSGIAALRGWAHGATGAVCASPPAEGTGGALLTALGLPVVSGVRQLFDWIGNGDRVALDSGTGEVIVNPSSAQAATFRR